ncbi:MAG: cytochrome d ubiquinol oxidase subunit II [Bacteroidales bacterium]|nr:cytochrome d ubiquinol oxidase subunit II [Bacteroidales bacterium]MBN2758445.1 cytochrome d ubiquinol oxidase subunit II [Bacteroidales bacterium]
MFENLSHLSLQQYWWLIDSLLGALLVFLLFVQGGQTLIYTLGKTNGERDIVVNSLGRKWEFTFTTLVTFGGALFASFPLFYSTSFGGAYWVWMAILFAFIIQAVSYEYRKKESNFLGKKTYEFFLFINGLLGTILLGTAVSTFFTGSMFSVNKLNLLNLSSDRMPVISSWETPFHGLEAVWTVDNLAFLQNLALGLAVFFLARTLALLYFQNNIDNEEINARTKKCLKINSVLFLMFFLFWLIRLMFIEGFAVNPETKEIFMEPYKYFNNLIEMPIVLIIMLIGVVLVLLGLFMSIFKGKDNGIWFTGPGTVLTVFALFLIAGYNNTSFYPSTFDLQSSLTIENSSSSHFTLTAMSYVSLIVPFVLAYIWFAWRAMDKKKITLEEIESESHSY